MLHAWISRCWPSALGAKQGRQRGLASLLMAVRASCSSGVRRQPQPKLACILDRSGTLVWMKRGEGHKRREGHDLEAACAGRRALARERQPLAQRGNQRHYAGVARLGLAVQACVGRQKYRLPAQPTSVSGCPSLGLDMQAGRVLGQVSRQGCMLSCS